MKRELDQDTRDALVQVLRCSADLIIVDPNCQEIFTDVAADLGIECTCHLYHQGDDDDDCMCLLCIMSDAWVDAIPEGEGPVDMTGDEIALEAAALIEEGSWP